MGKVNQKLGTNYQLFNYYGAPDAETVMVAMGSMCDAAEEVAFARRTPRVRKSVWRQSGPIVLLPRERFVAGSARHHQERGSHGPL